MNKTIEYLFEGFLIMVFCIAVNNWFSGSDNIDTLIDLSKSEIESDDEIINTSHVSLEQKYREHLAMVPYDDEYTIDEMKQFVEGRLVWIGNNANGLAQTNMPAIGTYTYVKIDNYLYKLQDGKYRLIRR